MGQPYWLDDERFASDESRGEHGEEISARMRQWTEQRETAEAVAALDEARVPCAEVLTPAQALTNEQVAAQEFLVPTTYPGLASPAPVARGPGSPWR